MEDTVLTPEVMVALARLCNTVPTTARKPCAACPFQYNCIEVWGPTTVRVGWRSMDKPYHDNALILKSKAENQPVLSSYLAMHSSGWPWASSDLLFSDSSCSAGRTILLVKGCDFGLLICRTHQSVRARTQQSVQERMRLPASTATVH